MESQATGAEGAPSVPLQGVSESTQGDNSLSSSPSLSQDELLKQFRSSKIKHKIDGKEVELTGEEILNLKSLEQASQERFQQAAKKMKEAEALSERAKRADVFDQFIEYAKKDPRAIWEFAEQFGHDPRKLAGDLLSEIYEYEKMTPEQRELAELRKYRESQEAERERSKQTEAERQQAQLEESYASRLNDEFEAFFKEQGTKPDPLTVKFIVGYLNNAAEEGKDMTVKEAYQRVLGTVNSYKDSWIDNLSASDLDRYPKLREMVRNTDLAKVQSQHVPGRKPPSGAQEARPASKKVLGTDNYFEKLDKKYKLA